MHQYVVDTPGSNGKIANIFGQSYDHQSILKTYPGGTVVSPKTAD